MAENAEMIDRLAPRFDGNNPQEWVSNIEAYLNFQKIPSDERLNITRRNLEGGASEWYEWMKRNNLLNSWKEFLERVKTCFEPSEFVHYKPELSKLTQKGSVAEFRAEFEGIVNNIVTGVSESLLVSFFVNGLRHDFRRQVAAAEPRTLVEAFALAAYYEEMSPAVAVAVAPWPNWGLHSPNLATPTKKLSPAELQEKRSKGLCFSCDKKFNPRHPCKCRG